MSYLIHAFSTLQFAYLLHMAQQELALNLVFALIYMLFTCKNEFFSCLVLKQH